MKYMFFKGCVIPVRQPFVESITGRVFSRLGIELLEEPKFTCCPEPVWFKSTNYLVWLSIAARNLCLAEEKGTDILTLCNGCAGTLMEANSVLKKNKEMKEKVNKILGETGHEFKGEIEVKHVLEVLKESEGLIKKAVKMPLRGVRVATFTGCHLLFPSEIMKFDVPEDPIVLDNLTRILGAEPVDYSEKSTCCGGVIAGLELDSSLMVVKAKIESATNADGGADCMVVPCPLCFQQLDSGQLLISRKMADKGFKGLPVLNYIQLLALAMGYSLDDIGYNFHKTKDRGFEEKIKNLAARG
jgi:heterodisulfide reductase subunit B